MQVMGVDQARDRAVRDYVLTEGRYFEKSGETVVDAGLAKSLSLSLGQKVRIGSRQGKISEFEIVGLIRQQGAAGITSAGIFFIPLRQAQTMFKETPPANVVRAQRVAAEKRNEEEQAELDKYYGAELAKVFDVSADQRTPEQREQLAAFFRKIEIGGDVVRAPNEVSLVREQTLEAFFLTHDLLRSLRIRPQIRVCGLFVYFGELWAEFAGVKGTPGVRGPFPAKVNIRSRNPESFCGSAFSGSE